MDSTLFQRPTASKTKRSREEDSESEPEPFVAEIPASRLPTKRVKLSVPPSVLAQRLSNLHIKDRPQVAVTSAEAIVRETSLDGFLPSCSSPLSVPDSLSDSDDVLSSDALFNDDLDDTVSVSADAPLSALQVQQSESLDEIKADVSDLISIHEDSADLQVHASTTHDADSFTLSELKLIYPKIYSGETLCAHTPFAGRVGHGVWEDDATCLDCLAYEHDDHQQDMDVIAYDLEEVWAGLNESGYEEFESSASENDKEVQHEDDDLFACDEKEWWEIQKNADEITMNLWLSEHAVDFAEGDCWEQWLNEPCNDVVAEVKSLLGAGFDDESWVDEDDYQDTGECPSTAETSTCLDCSAETLTKEMYFDRCQDCNLVRWQREIYEEIERKAERVRRKQKAQQEQEEMDEDDMNGL